MRRSVKSRTIEKIFGMVLGALLLAGGTALGREVVVQKNHPLVVNGYSLDPSAKEFQMASGAKWEARRKTPYQVIQFVGPVQSEWKESLASLGVKLFDYLPEYGFIARIPPAKLNWVRSRSYISYVGPFHPAFRLERNLDQIADTHVTVNVILFEGEKVDPVIDRIESLGGEILKRSPVDLQVRISVYQLTGLSTLEAVRWVEQARPILFHNSTTSWMIQSGIQDYRPIWDHGLRGEGQIIGFADSGIDWDHECFYDPAHPQVKYSDAGQTSPPDLSHRKIVNYWRMHGDGMDTSDHGTHVAGTLACDNAYLQNNSGNANGQGMAPKARLSFTDLTTTSYFPMPLVSEIPIIFNNQYSDAARIHSDSWGEFNQFGDYTAMTRAMDDYMWGHKDFLVLVANGNQGEVGPPATAKNIVSVGAETLSLGPTEDGRIKPTVVAPRSITSADSDSNLSSHNSGYRGMTGTSMATPAVAGGLALIRQYFIDGWYPMGQPNPANALSPSAALLKATLLAGTTELTTGYHDFKNEGKFPNNTQGWGFINLDGSLYFAGQKAKLWVVDKTEGLNTGQTISYTINVTDASEPFRVILVWTDAPAAYGSTQVLVNDLDLRVQSPDGKTYLGNVTQGLNPGHSATGGTADRVNVEEGVFLPSPQYGLTAGTYTITVEAVNVPQGPQPFAVALVGGLEGGAPSDTTPPAVTASTPAGGATGVPVSTTVSITFSEEMHHTSTTNAFSLQPATVGTVAWNGTTLVFTPASDLVEQTQYTVTLSTTAMDLAGNRLASPFSFSFTTAGSGPGPTPVPPRTPGMPTGAGTCYLDSSYSYFSSTTDGNGDRIQYLFDWGDGTTTTSSLVASGTRVEVSHTWRSTGTFNVRVQATDEGGLLSAWSLSLVVNVSELPPALITASSGDGSVGISSRPTESQQAQIFKSTVNSIQSLSLALAKVGTLNPDFRILVTIHTYKTSSYLAYAYIYPQDVASTNPASPSWTRVTFNKAISVSPGSYYYLVLRPSGTSGGGSYQWRTNSTNPYPDGMLLTGSNWTQVTNTDALMKIPSGSAQPNIPPSVPGSIEGPTEGDVGTIYSFSTLAHDPNGDPVAITFDWGDGTQTTTNQVASGTTIQSTHSWETTGTYQIRAKAIDSANLESAWGGMIGLEIAGADTIPPQISSISVSSISRSGALVTWVTDEIASTLVEYGTTSSYGIEATGNSPVASHSVQLTGLSPDTLYHFRVISEDHAGNRSTSGDSTFRTLPRDVTFPQLSDVHARFIAATTAQITWQTDEPSTSTVDFGATTTYGTTQGDSNLALTHRVEIGPLNPGTEYHYRVRSSDAEGNESPGNDRTLTTRSENPWTVYHSYNGPNGLVTELQRLAAEFPEIVQVTSIGQTHQGRDVWAIKISDNVSAEEDEPEVLFDSHFHGEEWIDMEVATYVAYQLVNNYGIDADVTSLINERQIWILPMVNPDGRILDSYGDENDPSSTRGWRKNARDNNNSGGWDSCDGVDLNRNFDLGYGVGASTSTCSLEYMGPSTFSEPEAQVFRTFAQSHDFRVYVSYHSYGERIFFPWGYRYDATPDDARFREVAQELKTYLPSYRSSQASLVDAAGGASDDWMYSNFHALVYTIEIAYADHGDPAQILPTVTPHFGAALHLISLADNPWQEAPNPPAAAFTANPTTGTVPLQVQFTDQSTGTIASWSWNFGDGAISAGQNPIHTYAQAGNYSVSLTVNGPDGSDTENKTSFIVVQPAPLAPDAGFTASPTTGTAPLQVQFTDQSTGTINTWSWTLGDGSSSTDRNPTHSFTQAGNYTVSLTVTGPGGSDTETKSSFIVVQPAPTPPEAAFTATPTTGTAPLQVQFTDQSTGAINSWSWAFGDGSTSTETNPLHTYAQAGTYAVSLTVTGPGGNDTEAKASFINVSPATPPQRLIVRIESTSADALVYGAYFYNNTKISYVGYYSNTQSDSTFWFGNVTIPQGAHIVHAEIRLQAAMEVSWACAVSIVGFAQDYPSPVMNVADWKSRPRTNASVLWNMDPWLKGSWYSSPEIAAIVQEIINRPGWVAGRALTFSIGPAAIGTSYRAFYERDQGYGYGAELIIDFLP